MTKIVCINEEKYDVYIGRTKNNEPGEWGNPWIIGPDGTREEVIEKYRQNFQEKVKNQEFVEKVLKLKNKTLGCFCKTKDRPNTPCHGDVIKEFLDKKCGLAIVGSRDFCNYQAIKDVFDKYFLGEFYYIVSGGAIGVDSCAKKLAIEKDMDYIEFLPDWKIGRHAGMLRNREIINNCSAVLAFWNGSSGTRNSLDLAKEIKKPSFIFYV